MSLASVRRLTRAARALRAPWAAEEVAPEEDDANGAEMMENEHAGQ